MHIASHGLIRWCSAGHGTRLPRVRECVHCFPGGTPTILGAADGSIVRYDKYNRVIAAAGRGSAAPERHQGGPCPGHAMPPCDKVRSPLRFM